MDQLEEMELDLFKRKSYTKKEMKVLKRKEREVLDEKLEQLDDLNDIIQFSSGIGGKKKQQREGDYDDDDGYGNSKDVLKIPKEFLK